MRRLDGTPELLDGPLQAPVLAGNLRDLARVNRWLGGTSLSWRAISPLLGSTDEGRPLRVIDVGTGSADIPRCLLGRAASRGLALDVVATDVRAEIVELARAAGSVPGLTIEQASADRIDAREGAYDVSHASMVVHHLDPPEAIRTLTEMGRVARQAVIINDLDRTWLWWSGAWLLSHLLTGNPYTRHDAPLSVRRGYRSDELVGLARRAGLRPVASYRTRPGYRYALVFVHALGQARGDV